MTQQFDRTASAASAKRAAKPAPFLDRYQLGITLFLLISTFLIVLLWDTIVVAEQPGFQGIYWSRFFGGTSTRILGEGTHVKFPWDEIISYDVRVVERHGTITLLTSDGMPIDVGWSVRYRPQTERLPLLNQRIGPDYGNTYVIPEVVASLRETLGKYRADAIYARDESSLTNEFEQHVIARVNVQPIRVEHVLITRLDLPHKVTEGIVKKLLDEQNLLAYQFRLDAEQKERERKIIEAQGIRDFEKISKVSMLKWQGLQATVELAKSPNSKVIVIGTSSQSMPLLLNGEK